MFKINKTYLICLICAGILISGTLAAQAIGFFSYEDGDKFVLWANVRLVNNGLKLSDQGVDELAIIDGGNVNIEDKHVYIRGFMGLNCLNYPTEINCSSTLGDIGGKTFLKTDQLGTAALSKLELQSALGIDLIGDSINFEGNLILNNNKNLYVTSLTTGLPATSNSVFSNSLNVREITNLASVSDTLNLADVSVLKDAYFNPKKVIIYPVQ